MLSFVHIFLKFSVVNFPEMVVFGMDLYFAADVLLFFILPRYL